MIVNRLYDWAARQPDKPAIIHNDDPISYADFAHAIDATRRYLSGQDLPVGLTAVVLVGDPFKVWVVTLGLRSLGMTTIVVVSLVDAEKLGLKDIGAVVTSRHDAAALKITRPKAFGRRIITISDAVWHSPRRGSLAPIEDPHRPYGGHILYTSGTTGSSKKVLEEGRDEDALSQRCAVHRLIERDSIVHNLSFGMWAGVGYKQPLSVWRMGATLVIDNPLDALRDFFKHRPTFVSMTPAMARELLVRTAAMRRPDKMPIINLGGGFVAPQLIKALHNAKFDQVMISYSSTECSHILRSHVEDDDQIAWLSPTGDRRVEIVDSDDRPCAVGEEGMLRVALLDHDAHAYLDDPSTTADVFRDGWFYPGDLAVQRADGRIRILGRVGDVLNLGGEKVAAGPLEQHIGKFLDVDNVCLFQGVAADGVQELVVVLEANELPDAAMIARVTTNIRAFDRVRFEAVRPFPRTSTGLQKIHRAELRRMVFSAVTG